MSEWHLPAHGQHRDLSLEAAALLHLAGRRLAHERPFLLAAARADVLVAADAADGVQVVAGVLGRARGRSRGNGGHGRGGRKGGRRGDGRTSEGESRWHFGCHSHVIPHQEIILNHIVHFFKLLKFQKFHKIWDIIIDFPQPKNVVGHVVLRKSAFVVVYLRSRSRCNRYNSQYSDITSVHKGVPQGSGLGSLLFTFM